MSTQIPTVKDLITRKGDIVAFMMASVKTIVVNSPLKLNLDFEHEHLPAVLATHAGKLEHDDPPGLNDLAYPCMYRAVTIVLRKDFSASEFWECVERYKVNGFYIVPTMWNILLRVPEASSVDNSAVTWACSSSCHPVSIRARLGANGRSSPNFQL